MQHSPAVRFLRDYVAVPSVNPMGRSDLPAEVVGERRYAELVQHHLSKMSVDSKLVGSGERRSIVARVDSPGARQTLLVASHLDTVPVDSMTIPPFDPVVAGGRLSGRGSCDTKAGLAALLAALERVLSRGRLRRNLVVVGEADEEAESLGLDDVLDALGEEKVDFALATEPTELRLVNAHKGTALVRVAARGRACHSSDPTQGQSAIVNLSRAVLALDRLGQRLLVGRRHAELGTATLSIGLIAGGQAPNIVPDRATLTMDRRTLPGETLEEVRGQIEAAFAAEGLHHLEVTEVLAGKAPLFTSDGHAASTACHQALDAAGVDAPAVSVPFGTDAGLLSQHGIPALVLGPGSIRQAHTDDEYVDVQQVETMVQVFEQLLEGC